MSKAHDLIETPDDSVHEAMAAVEEASAASESLSRCDLTFDDGSTLSVASFRGASAELSASDGDAPVVSAPRLDDSPPPQGIGDDGVRRDEHGGEVTA